jgi:hypothetical protein
MRDVDGLINWLEITEYGNIVLYARQGLGDQIIAAGLVKFLSEKFQHIYFICKPYNEASVKHLFQTLSNVSVVPCPLPDSSNVEQTREWIKQLCDLYNAQLFHAMHGWTFRTQLSWIEGCYEQYGLPYSARYSMCPTILPGPRSEKLYKMLRPSDKPYVIMHITSSERATYDVDVYQGRGKDCFNNKDILHITPLTNNLFDWIKLLQHAEEIHVVDSSVHHLCESINDTLNGHVYFHDIRDYTFKDPVNIILPYVKDNWTIAEYNCKQYK